MAEHVKAIAAADEILSVPGIDVVFIGPNDLHNSMGKPPSFESNDKEFVDAVNHVFKMARKHGVAPGIHVVDAEAAVGSEAGLMLSKAQEVMRTLGLATGKGTVAKY
jgi:4-hydroxy-2-oxoheptanedioate aldolase